ncbi:hypothetical protein [Paenisporosarcina sp. NPDC076898]|uniref:hypothetical protein n=1 Tax=unclassified Paenisporosarcina TaxID=2642018 RepID=UPI003CFF9318
MTNQQNTDQQGNQISKGIKEKAGAAFHAVHSALEKTENAAMNAVDKTANAVNGLTNKSKNKTGNSSNNLTANKGLQH